MNSYTEMLELMEQKGIKCPELEFEYLYETNSFLKYLGATFSMAGFRLLQALIASSWGIMFKEFQNLAHRLRKEYKKAYFNMLIQYLMLNSYS